ncbi:hypothetical protein R80B4_01871 [Fibrobacteres bacterium R8-0-B4]
MTFFTKHGRRTLLLLSVAIIASQPVLAQPSQNYIGDGGKGISLTIYVPQSTGLAKEQSYIPALVQGEFVSNFSNYSAISILDWERLDDIYVKLVDEAYDDKAAAKQDVVLGRLAPTTHFLTGNITKTKTGYNIKMNITATTDKMTAATYSGTFTFTELDNLTGVRRASLELLQKVGVELTETARQELAGAATTNQVLAQTALAKGVTAQRAGTEVAALSYYYQAASFDPALKEAVKRSSITAANISSGNIGADIRNDILWRKKWVARLNETEESVSGMIEMIMNNAVDPPYSLVYLTDIKTGKVDYKTETAELSITVGLNIRGAWFAAIRKTLAAADQATQAVLDGLYATNRKEEWELDKWPKKGVSNANPFAKASKKGYDLTVVFELVNKQGRVIGSQTVKLNPEFSINPKGYRQNWRFTVDITGDDVSTVTFKGVKANDISDNLTIRVASVNGALPQQARLAITAKAAVAEKLLPLIDSRDNKRYNTVRIGGDTWMAQNLNYLPQTGNSWCYKNDENNTTYSKAEIMAQIRSLERERQGRSNAAPKSLQDRAESASQNDNSMCEKYGRLYDWSTALSVCPIGWRLPSQEEWGYLNKWVGEEAGKKLRSTSDWDHNRGATDEYGWSALPGGGRRYSDGDFYDVERSGYWWTATESADGNAYFRYINYDSYMLVHDNVASGQDNKGSSFSVRCVTD